MKALLKLKMVFFGTFIHVSLLAQGLILDEAADNAAPRLPLFSGEKGLSSMPSEYSLRSFCPTPDDQGATNSCVAFACGYGAYTILEAKRKGWSNAMATQNAFSAAYIFNQIGSQSGMSFGSAFTFMSNKGDCRATTFSNQHIFKGTSPTQAAIDEANRNKITPPPIPKIGGSVSEIKTILAQGFPVIFGASVEADFRKRTFTNGLWTPQKTTEPHALLIVGYDDKSQTFDIMNSYGKQWGNGGFIKLRYIDVPQVFRAAYVLGSAGSRGFDDEDAEKTTPIDPSQRETVGSFGLKNFIEKTKTLDGRDSFAFENTRVFFNNEKQVYETNRRDWQVGEIFQFSAASIPSGKYLYVFSRDAANKLTIHWPPDARWTETDERTSHYYAPNFGKVPVSALILSPKTQLTIPAPDEGLQVNQKGTDHLIVLVADQNITDFKQRLEIFKNTVPPSRDEAEGIKGGIVLRLQKAFGDALVPQNRLVYRKDTMQVQRFSYETNGWVVPMVLAVKLD